jgi:hypothetical protein
MSTFEVKIQFHNDGKHPIVNFIRSEAKLQKWVGKEGVKEFMLVEYNAILRTNRYGAFSSVTFFDENLYNTFKAKMEII